jgi:N-acetyllactosaminide alpha-2,3-sialyltransferase
MTSALVLCRTPAQANLVDRVLDHERVDSFDLLYFTQQNSPEDKRYFSALAQRARLAKFIHVPPSRWDILNHIRLRARAGSFMRDLRHDIVVLASIDSYVFNAVAKRQAGAQLVTFDDGLANIVLSGAYRRAGYEGRGEAYRRLFGASRLDELRDRIARHYTIFPQFENIVPRERLRPIDLLSDGALPQAQGPLFFIGQPFHEVLTPERIARLSAYLRKRQIDFYVRHPRERRSLDIGAREFDKQGLIAEDAILKICHDCRPEVIGLTSTVLFSLPQQRAAKTMLVFRDGEPSREAEEAEALGRTVGCSICEVP